MAYNALYLAGTCWNNPLSPPEQFAVPGVPIRTRFFDQWQDRVNFASYGFVGYWWPLFLDYNEAKEADDPSVRNTTTKEALTLMFREFSYTEDRPGLNGETSGLVKFYMPLDKAIKHLLTDCRYMWSVTDASGNQRIPFEGDGDENEEEIVPGIRVYRRQFFNDKGEPYLRPAYPMLKNVPPLPGLNSKHGSAWVAPRSGGSRPILDATGAVLRPGFSVESQSWARDAGLLDDDPKYDYTYLVPNTQFARLWPKELDGFTSRVPRHKLYLGITVDQPDHLEPSFIGYGNNVVGNIWGDQMKVEWRFLDLVPPVEFDLNELQRLATLHNLWVANLDMDIPGPPIQENWADAWVNDMFWRIGDVRDDFWEFIDDQWVLVKAGPEPLPQEYRQTSIARFKECPVPDYVIEGNTIYDWMQWASAMAGGWPEIGERHRRDRIGLRAHLEQGDIGPNTIVQWRGKNWRVAGNDEETRMDNVRWITAPPTGSAPSVWETWRNRGQWRHHPCALASGVGWETLKRWRRLIPPPADGNEGVSGADFGYNTIDYGILLADNPPLVPGYPWFGQNTELKPINPAWEGSPGFPERLGGPIPDAIKDPHGDGDRGGLDWGWDQSPEDLEAADNAPWWRKVNDYKNFINEENPGIFFEKFGRLPVWEEVCAPLLESPILNPVRSTNKWPEDPLRVFNENDPNEQWKIDQTRRAKGQIIIPPLFDRTYPRAGPWQGDNSPRLLLRKWKKWAEGLQLEDGEWQKKVIEYTFDVCINFNKSIRPGLAPGPTDGMDWDYRDVRGNVAGIHWGKPQLREIVATSFTQNVQGERVANTQSAIYYSPWEGTPVWYLALTNYSEIWAPPFPINQPWVANPPLWLMPAPPSYAIELLSEQDDNDMIMGVGVPGAIASQEFLALLQQNTRFLARQVGFRGLRGVFSPD